MSEFDRKPVSPQSLQPARYFAAGYAGEHIAGTEFVIGATFVAWGLKTSDILWGLLMGNLLAVLTWALVCAPIAVQTRLTLYAYLERIAGPQVVKLYSIINGLLFCVLAGAMITVSASAVRILFAINPQVKWYPTDPAFVLVVAAVGSIVVLMAVRGFRALSQFAEVSAPWMITMFICGGLVVLPSLIAVSGEVVTIGTIDDFIRLADGQIYRGGGDMGLWHVAAFAWIANFAMHGALSDMTLLRFARRWSYGFYSVLGMFIGHYMAWISAGIMGAGAALALETLVTQLDAGSVAYQALGPLGILVVVIAGWTTSNPTIYRAGLAFQSLNPRWRREKVTMMVGVATTAIACFPFVFTGLLDFVGWMALILAPVGGIIFTEHWLFPRFGQARCWSFYRDWQMNPAFLAAWAGSLVLTIGGFAVLGWHNFFAPPVAWLIAGAGYLVLARQMGAGDPDLIAKAAAADVEDQPRRQREILAMSQRVQEVRRGGNGLLGNSLLLVSGLGLVACMGLAIAVYSGGETKAFFARWLGVPTALYFVAALMWIRLRE